MSTIVAVTKNGRACIAADSLTTFGSTRQSASFDLEHDKISTIGDSYMGIVGSAAHQMVLDSALESLDGKVDFSSRRAIFETFRALHPVLKDDYFLNPKDEDDDDYESSRIDALIVNKKGVFGIYALREVFQYTQYWAIGSGSEYALGALHALYDRMESAEDLAIAAVRAGAEFDASSAMPHTVYSVVLDSAQNKTIQV